MSASSSSGQLLLLFLGGGREKDLEQFVDTRGAFKHGLRVVVLVQIDHVLQQDVDTLVAAVSDKAPLFVPVLPAKEPSVEIDDVLRDLVRVGSLVMHIEEFQIVLRVIVVCSPEERRRPPGPAVSPRGTPH